ncbi:LuxR family transcriptional regulator [Leptothermofonsia sichuanensis E412]|uniref:LuxR C-terminal-related transcriptional regulator n=1 Tax=Leptothermofonsia sichuanensis TaxID=2917832 RepID=UPI001CA60BED|nr:LuxR C-terminal-related transcriptional regulator [Leptothermofonsia sichuanensis]QZZ19113.1 LuxR family transcriptional regulator [Leptothermofonsia sichuanensis E412]
MDTSLPNLKQSSLLQAILEGLIDGILVLSDQGEWIHANDCARRICRQLSKGIPQPDRVPQEIWNTCKRLIENLSLHPNQTVPIEDEINTESVSYRLRAQWLNLDATHPYVLVTLEDRLQSIQSLAIAEGHRYGLTPREIEVWIRHRANYTYRDIASELYISHNTVKKHMKNIHAKRHLALETH